MNLAQLVTTRPWLQELVSLYQEYSDHDLDYDLQVYFARLQTVGADLKFGLEGCQQLGRICLLDDDQKTMVQGSIVRHGNKSYLHGQKVLWLR